MQGFIANALLLGGAAAFPHMGAQMMGLDIVKRQAYGTPKSDSDSYTGAKTTIFSASDQLVSDSGVYAFKAPSGNDIRGPCPGLNAAANHGYISRNGLTNLQEAIDGTNKMFNMGRDLGGFLSAYSVITDGDPLTLKWSIGGSPAKLGEAIGNGLTGSHNKYETDSSPMRGDYYQYNGNNYGLQLSQFKEFYSIHSDDEDDNYTFDDLVTFRGKRFQESVSQNPNFYYGPFSGILVSQAAFTFISAFMSNHSAAYPNGFLSGRTMRSFMSVTKDSKGNLAWVPGNERIPSGGWYRRSSTNQYTIPEFELDASRIWAAYPETLGVGGNSNGVNTYSGVDISNVTGGLYSTQGFLKNPASAFCFGTQFLQIGLTDVLLKVIQPYLPSGCPKVTNAGALQPTASQNA